MPLQRPDVKVNRQVDRNHLEGIIREDDSAWVRVATQW